MKEIWKDVKGYEGCYQISNKGRVKSLKRIVKKSYPPYVQNVKKRILKPNIDKDGYAIIMLGARGNKDHARKHFKIHRLVGIAFIPNPKKLPCINHLNGKKLDNRPVNLEWCTSPDNIKHAVVTGLRDFRGVLHHNCRLTENNVRKIRKLRNIKNFKASVLAKMFNISVTHVGYISNYKSWQHI